MISLYGISISFSILGTLLFAYYHLTKKDSHLWNITLYATLAGLIGARLYHVLDYSNYYLEYPLRIFALYKGGLGIWGGLFGGALGVCWYIKKYKLDSMYYLDLIAVITPLGQAIGRLGNFLNQELFGLPTNFFLKIYISPNKRPLGYEQYEYFHPLFFYESFLNLILFTTLYLLYKKKLIKGLPFYTYCAGYALIRGSLDFLRIDPWKISFLNVSQAISILVLVVALIKIYALLFSGRSRRI